MVTRLRLRRETAVDESSRASGAFEFHSFDYCINAAVFSVQFSLDILHADRKKEKGKNSHSCMICQCAGVKVHPALGGIWVWILPAAPLLPPMCIRKTEP